MLFSVPPELLFIVPALVNIALLLNSPLMLKVPLARFHRIHSLSHVPSMSMEPKLAY